MRLWYKYFAPMLVSNLVRKPNSNLNFGAFLKYLPLLGVVDPKNWTLPVEVELETRKEVQDGKETKF